MKLFLQYLKQHRRAFMTSSLFCIVFAVSFFLYRLPMKAVIYPILLCTVIGALIISFDFARVKHEYKALKSIRSITEAISERFPRIDGPKDEAYQEIIRLIAEEHKAYRAETGRKYADMMDYYTVWVHQIKTPIASMRLHMQNEDTALSRKLTTDLYRIEQYVEMVLTFLRLNADSTDYLIKAYDLDGIIRQAVKKFSSAFIEKRLRLVYKPLNTTVITDEKWLSFVIEQVLSNAIKYTPSGSVTISLTGEKALRIEDTGIGIAPEDLPRIFENGYTGYNGRLDKKASGIGLYLCKRICTNLGHKITAVSTMNVGTAIEIDLAQANFEIE